MNEAVCRIKKYAQENKLFPELISPKKETKPITRRIPKIKISREI
jgi:hypothetical protein